MKDVCSQLRDDLWLYCEGELADPFALQLVRRHLRRCADCSRWVDEFDEDVRSLFESAAPEIERTGSRVAEMRRKRAGAIVARVEALSMLPGRRCERTVERSRPPRTSVVGLAERAERTERRLVRREGETADDPSHRATATVQRMPARRVRHREAVAAAVLIAGVAGVFAGALWVDGNATRLAESPAPQDRSRPQAADAYRSSTAHSTRWNGEREISTELQWHLEPASRERPHPRLVGIRHRLGESLDGRAETLDLDLERSRATTASLEPEWLVEVELDPDAVRSRGDTRYILVPVEGVTARGGRWFIPLRAIRGRERERDEPLRVSGARLYHVFVDEGAETRGWPRGIVPAFELRPAALPGERRVFSPGRDAWTY